MLVDNASSDGTVAVARRRREVTVIEAGANLGYSGAINLGRAHSGPFASLLIVNPDLVLEPGSIERLFRAISEPGVGIAVPKLLEPDGTLYLTLRRDPSISRALGDALLGARFLPQRPGWLSETLRNPRDYEHEQDAAWATGAIMLVSAECDSAVGSWDDRRFFLYSEETDYATRARRSGYTVRYVPTAQVRHDGGGSGSSPTLGALLAINKIRYFEKYHQAPTTWLFRLVIALHHLLRANDPTERAALRAVLRRSEWAQLPGGIP